ncbi:Protein CREG1,Protein CREG2 [Lepeophtheirus salmonis]|uniref:Protein CREG1,Protein CREG2 n=1 Tax=Lepeophtheirus salmonis TaxID=72036 RepID=A0A7R8CAQ5_LEPSM|nr:protein CREG1-like isoform X2 [Lepeophtheirus salmonis]CAB4054199.1 Protein CREG1,Protein CREG2 [Lepeophtheirus salmonis]CAF2753488.1 Protein CREG1,Protein CREG2 [Lepeophtheirus salmonis]
MMNIILTSLFPILLSLLLFEDAQATWSHSRHHERHNGLYKIQAGFEELFEIRNDPPPPPPHEKVAKMARYVVHLSDWIAISTISTRSPTVGRAFANVFSMSDGTNKNSSGVPFFYLTPMEMSVKDLQVDNHASMTASLAETNYCARMEYDPMDPLCAHVILNGRIVKVTSTEEQAFAKRSLFSRHPEMADWPKGHKWYFAKMNIESILVLDFFGGAKSVSPESYFKATPY